MKFLHLIVNNMLDNMVKKNVLLCCVAIVNFSDVHLSLSQIVILFNSLFNISTNFVYSLPSRKTLVSSAKRIVKKNNLDALEKLFIKIIIRSGTKIDPCGTPYSMDCVLELHSL